MDFTSSVALALAVLSSRRVSSPSDPATQPGSIQEPPPAKQQAQQVYEQNALHVARISLLEKTISEMNSTTDASGASVKKKPRPKKSPLSRFDKAAQAAAEKACALLKSKARDDSLLNDIKFMETFKALLDATNNPASLNLVPHSQTIANVATRLLDSIMARLEPSVTLEQTDVSLQVIQVSHSIIQKVYALLSCNISLDQETRNDFILIIHGSMMKVLQLIPTMTAAIAENTNILQASASIRDTPTSTPTAELDALLKDPREQVSRIVSCAGGIANAALCHVSIFSIIKTIHSNLSAAVSGVVEVNGKQLCQSRLNEETLWFYLEALQEATKQATREIPARLNASIMKEIQDLELISVIQAMTVSMVQVLLEAPRGVFSDELIHKVTEAAMSVQVMLDHEAVWRKTASIHCFNMGRVDAAAIESVVWNSASRIL
ncbi:hypothetical protein HDU78_007513 [Chytriomyces hyalinus]|nr:hypothetical protein HDU78_007513 [Chytriomyces hyalinus]